VAAAQRRSGDRVGGSQGEHGRAAQHPSDGGEGAGQRVVGMYRSISGGVRWRAVMRARAAPGPPVRRRPKEP
jgi:hypothetical protein